MGRERGGQRGLIRGQQSFKMIGLLFCIDHASFVGMMSLSLDLLSWLILVIGEVWYCCFLTSSVSLVAYRPKLKVNSTDFTQQNLFTGVG